MNSGRVYLFYLVDSSGKFSLQGALEIDVLDKLGNSEIGLVEDLKTDAPRIIWLPASLRRIS